MKCILCLKCGSLVQMKQEERACDCEHVKGKYLANNLEIAIKTSDIGQIRIVGIANDWINQAIKDDSGSYPPYIMSEEEQKESAKNSLFIRRMRPIIMVFPFTTDDIKTYEEVRLE